MYGQGLIPDQLKEFLRYSAITGFIVVATLLININHKFFDYVLKDKARSYWWVFVILAIIPLLLFLYTFTFIFGRLFST